jgi:hypothetical protein
LEKAVKMRFIIIETSKEDNMNAIFNVKTIKEIGKVIKNAAAIITSVVGLVEGVRNIKNIGK